MSEDIMPEPLGHPPDVDLVVVTDHSALTRRPPVHFFRIHLDVPVEARDAAQIDRLLADQRLADVYQLLLQGYLRPNGHEGSPADLTLRGALGQ